MNINQFAKVVTSFKTQDLQHCYEMGKDSVINGSNETNCHFSLFSSKERMEAWTKGVQDAKAEVKHDHTTR